MRWLTAAVAWQSRAVVERHLRVHLRNWHTAFLPPALEPVTSLLAFGLGLGSYVGALSWRGREVPYLSFIAPGMLAYTTFMTAMFQSLYAAFIRMHFQKTWEGQLTTQVELRHVIWGEVLWAALLTTIYASIVACVLAACRLLGLLDVSLAWLPTLLPVVFVAACAFSALGLLFTALIPTIDHMNLPIFLFVLPLALFSGTYFPLEHPVARALNTINPVYHLAEGLRGVLVGGAATAHLLAAAVLSALMLTILIPLDMRLLSRRVLGE
ncbi:MAG TPA: ABC transporter permease [Methylomirabilota bacterium]|jgi:lipooligosaccharide transport system permease protein|nr:ABC transporter permease [Methylomirabilota bacterium]